VEWSIVDAKGKDLKGEYLWFDLGRSAEYVKGDSSGTGVAKITVKYTQSGSDKYPEIV
jgi:hypothetical protein